jgi:lipopolysaccharide heptosyltransferase I
MSGPARLLLIRLSSLGDILHAVPAANALRAAWPQARIDWLVEERMRFLLDAVPGVDRVISIDTRAARGRPLAPAWRALAATVASLRRERYDVAIDFQGLIKTGLLALLCGARQRIGFSKRGVRERPASWFYTRTVDPPVGEMHVARLNLLLAEAAGAPRVPAAEPLRIDLAAGPKSAGGQPRGAEQLSELVVINPGGGWPTKRWSPRRYGELAHRIQSELGLRTVVTIAPGEDSLYREIARHVEPPPERLEVPFLGLIPIVRGARLFISGDTGPMHLASALGTPVVAIFGPTSPVRNGPLGTDDETVVHRLHCSFCYGRSCPTQNECMDIPVDEVFAAVRRRLLPEPGPAPEEGAG